MLSSPQRLTSDSDIRTVLKKGAFVFSRHIKILWKKNGKEEKARWAIIVSKKVSKHAIVRNGIRRVLQGVIVDLDVFGVDVVVIVRSPIETLDKKALRNEFFDALGKTPWFNKEK